MRKLGALAQKRGFACAVKLFWNSSLHFLLKSVAHYTYFISCVRPFREVAGINHVNGLQLNTAFLPIQVNN